MTLCRLFLAVCFLTVSFLVRAEDYYIYCSTTNAGTGDGTLSNPYRALSSVTAIHIGTNIAAGRTVYVALQRGSIFRERWILPTNNFRVVAYAGPTTNNPIIAADDVLTGWGANQSLPGAPPNVWTITKANASQLFANGQWRFRQGDVTLLKDGQWYYTGATIYYCSDAGNPDTLGVTMECSARDFCAYGVGRTNITFTDIDMRRAYSYAMRCQNGGHYTFTRCSFYETRDSMTLDNVTNVTCINCVFRDNNIGDYRGAWLVNTRNSTSNLVFYFCLFDESNGNAIGDTVSAGGANALVNCTFAGIRGYHLLAPAGTYWGITNCIFSGTGVGQSGTAMGIKCDGTGVMQNCLVAPGFNPTIRVSGGMTEYNSVLGDPYYASRRYPVYFVFTRDDTPSLPFLTNDVALLKGRGLSWPVVAAVTPTLLTPQTEDAMRWLVNNGGEVAVHGMWHSSVEESRAFLLKYVGSASTATLSISGNTLTTYTNSVQDQSYSFAGGAYDTIGKLVSALNTGDYRATNMLKWGINDSVPSSLLAEVSAIDIKGVFSTNELVWTSYNHEMLVHSKELIESIVGNGYTVKSFVDPGSTSDRSWPAVRRSTSRTNMVAAGYTSDRSVAQLPFCDYLLYPTNNPFNLGNAPMISGNCLCMRFTLKDNRDDSIEANTFAGVGISYTSDVPAQPHLGNAAVFNGSGCLYRSVGNSFTNIGSDWVFSTWIYPSNITAGVQTIFYSGFADDSSYLWIYLNNGDVHLDIVSNGVTTASATATAALSSRVWKWLWVQQRYGDLIIRVNDIQQCLVSGAPGVQKWPANTSTNWIGSRRGTSDFFQGRMDFVEFNVGGITKTHGLLDAMSECGGVIIDYTHGTGPGRFLITAEALQSWPGTNLFVVKQSTVGDIIQTNGVLLGVDGFTRFRTNALIGYANYTLLPNSPLIRAAFPIGYPANMSELSGKPVTSASLSLGAFQFEAPLRAALVLQGTSIVLNWTGGSPPYRVQCATDLTLGDWKDVLSDATPPVALSPTDMTGFYRVIGQ